MKKKRKEVDTPMGSPPLYFIHVLNNPPKRTRFTSLVENKGY